MKERRVLLIAPQPFFQWRGSPIRVGFNLLALSELGFRVDMLALPIGEDKTIPGVRIIRVSNPFRIRNIPIGPSAGKMFFDCLLLVKAIALSVRNKYDFVHCIEDAGVAGVIIAWLTGAKLIFEKHSDPASYRKGKLRNLMMSLYGGIEAFVARRADAVIGTGEGLVEQVRAMNPRGTVHHIFDIPSSLAEPDEAGTKAVRNALCRSPEEVLLTYVGSFAVYQGIDIIFGAMPAVLKRHPNARLVIIGGSPQEIAERRAALAGNSAMERVTFLGRIPPDALPDYLAASDILLSPRIAGINTPLKLLDYLKAGRAILATDNPANRRILDEHCAVLVQPAHDAFARGASLLIEDPVLRKKLGEQGRHMTSERYNFDEFKKRLHACYRATRNTRDGIESGSSTCK